MLKFLYDLFSSVKLAIFLLLTLAATSIIGTIVEQQQDPDKYLKEYGEAAYRIFKFLGFTDVYHSWWYVLLLSLLGVNLIVCSVKRLPKIWKVARHPRKTLPEGSEVSLKIAHRLTISAGDIESVANAILNVLSKFGYKTEKIKSDSKDEIYIFSDKNVFARFGVYIVHFGVLIVLIGGLLTALFGFRGYMNLCEGCGSNLVTFFGSEKVMELPFTVVCDKFNVEFYPSGMPKKYLSKLSVVENGKVAKREMIEVNTPLKYKNIYFYQASFGRGAFLFYVKRENGEPAPIAVALGQPFKVSDNIYLSLISFSKSRIEVQLTRDGRVTTAVIEPRTWYKIPGSNVSVALADFKAVSYTGLQVSYDPGTWVVWTGSTILVLGLIVAFFVSHRRVWGRVKLVRENKVNVVIGGIASKGTEGLGKELEEVLGVLESSYFTTPKEERDG